MTADIAETKKQMDLGKESGCSCSLTVDSCCLVSSISDGMLNLFLQDLLAFPAVESGSEALCRTSPTCFSNVFSEGSERRLGQRWGTGLLLSAYCPLIQCLQAQCVLHNRYMYAASLVLGYIFYIKIRRNTFLSSLWWWLREAVGEIFCPCITCKSFLSTPKMKTSKALSGQNRRQT